MSESSPFSEREFPRLPTLTESEVEQLSRAITDSPDLMRRLEMDPAGDEARNQLVSDAVSRDIEELYAILPSVDELRHVVDEAYSVRVQDPGESDDPDF